MYNLGIFYQRPKQIQPSIHRAIEIYNEASEYGNLSAMYNLGTIYEAGVSSDDDNNATTTTTAVPKDLYLAEYYYTRIIQHYQKSKPTATYKNDSDDDDDDHDKSESDDIIAADAMYRLASIYTKRLDVEKNTTELILLLEGAIKLGNSDAVSMLVTIYLEGKYGIEPDLNYATSLSHKSQRPDLVDKCEYIYELQSMLDQGIVVGLYNKNNICKREFLKHFTLQQLQYIVSYVSKPSNALLELIYRFSNGRRGAPLDYNTAFKWCQRWINKVFPLIKTLDDKSLPWYELMFMPILWHQQEQIDDDDDDDDGNVSSDGDDDADVGIYNDDDDDNNGNNYGSHMRVVGYLNDIYINTLLSLSVDETSFLSHLPRFIIENEVLNFISVSPEKKIYSN
jgi:TPR repeat protein